MEREERVKELSAWLMTEIDSFAEYQDGKMTLYALCKILAKSVLNFNLVKEKNDN